MICLKGCGTCCPGCPDGPDHVPVAGGHDSAILHSDNEGEEEEEVFLLSTN